MSNQRPRRPTRLGPDVWRSDDQRTSEEECTKRPVRRRRTCAAEPRGFEIEMGATVPIACLWST
eukprot:8413093-Heterocapsa_arctica.AAC.1